MYQLTEEINEDYVLRHLTEEQIMEHYVGRDVRIHKKFSSPFRRDDDPSCSFAYSGGRLVFKDFSGSLKGNCFHIVSHIYKCNFYQAVEHVAQDFNLEGTDNIPTPKKIFKKLEEIKKKGDTLSEIKVKVRKWKQIDKDYWYSRFGLTTKTLRHFNVYPIRAAWINGTLFYSHKEKDPCYAYRLATGEYKLYFVNRVSAGKKTRFLNNSTRIQGYRQLPKKERFIIYTKSMKDVMVLYQLGIPAIALPSETQYPTQKLIDHISKRFRYAFTLYDFDNAGISMACHFRRKHYIDPFFLTDGTRRSKIDYGSKDVSEYVDNNGYDKLRVLCDELKVKVEKFISEQQLDEIPFY